MFMNIKEITTLYEKNGLDTSKTKDLFEQAKPLFECYQTITPRKVDFLEYLEWWKWIEKNKKFDVYVGREFKSLINLMNENAIRDFDLSKYSLENFDKLSISDKLNLFLELNEKYTFFLECKKISIIKSYLESENNSIADEEMIKKICFLELVFEEIESQEDKNNEYFIGDYDFKEKIPKKLIHLKSDLEKISKTLDISLDDLENIFKSTKEIREEISFFRMEYEILEKEKEEIYASKFNELIYELENAKKKAQKEESELKLKIQEEEKARIIGENEGNTGEMEKIIKDIQGVVTVKEPVIPIIVYWPESKNSKVPKKELERFFEEIKQIENKKGKRVSLFLLTSAGKDVTLARLKQFQEEGKKHNMPRLVEGALGGYGSFFVMGTEEIVDTAIMSPQNRKKISESIFLKSEEINLEEENYLRYELGEVKNSEDGKPSLNRIVTRLNRTKNKSIEQVKFIPYVERNLVVIDVVLNSQFKTLFKFADYYKAKYHITKGESMIMHINDIGKTIKFENGSRKEESFDQK